MLGEPDDDSGLDLPDRLGKMGHAMHMHALLCDTIPLDEIYYCDMIWHSMAQVTSRNVTSQKITARKLIERKHTAQHNKM